jgi:hypothetical protein
MSLLLRGRNLFVGRDNFPVFYGRAYRQRLELRNSTFGHCGDVRAVRKALNTAQVVAKQKLPCFTKQLPSVGITEIKGRHIERIYAQGEPHTRTFLFSNTSAYLETKERVVLFSGTL